MVMNDLSLRLDLGVVVHVLHIAQPVLQLGLALQRDLLEHLLIVEGLGFGQYLENGVERLYVLAVDLKCLVQFVGLPEPTLFALGS